MDHDHLFSFSLTERHKCLGCISIAGWVDFKSRLRHCTEGKNARTDPFWSKYAFWNSMEVNWDHVGWIMYHPLWRKRYSTWLQREIPSSGCYIEQRFFSVLIQILAFEWSNTISSKCKEKKSAGVVHRLQETVSPEKTWKLYNKPDLSRPHPDLVMSTPEHLAPMFRSLSRALLPAYVKSTIWTAEMLLGGNPSSKVYGEGFCAYCLRQILLLTL